MRLVSTFITQVRFENKAFWRNPVAAFFTFVFPLMFLVIFNLIFGNEEMTIDGGTTHTSTFYVPAIVALSVISACYTNVAIGVALSRDKGVLKRLRGTPLPSWIFILAKIAQATFVAVVLVIIVTAAGVIFYDVDAPSNTLPAFIVTLIVGAAAFSALVLAVTAVIPNADASPAIVNASVLPLMFFSDVFIPLQDAPAWLVTFSEIFPVKHFSAALMSAFNPFESGTGLELRHIGLLAVSGGGGLVVATRWFTWEPNR